MTTNQTIDGVPREQMISFPRELDDELRSMVYEFRKRSAKSR